MNTRSRMAVAALAAVLVAGPAVAGGRSGETWYVEAAVLAVQPLVEHVRVSEPRRHCRDERVERLVPRHGHGPRTETILGTVIGGAIGHNAADGDHRGAARLVGAIVGAAIGRDIGARRAPPRRVFTTERICDVEYVSYEEERVTGYRVVYRYNGRRRVTYTDTDPGATIRLRVHAAPIHYNGAH